MRTTTLLRLIAVIQFANAATFEVSVGPNLAFSPSTVTAAKGDIVVFKLVSTEHNVAQSTFEGPCQPSTNGFYSGFPSASNTDQTFTVTINDTNPIYFYCSVQGHCQNGMVGAVNAPSSGNTLDAYKKAASGARSGTPATIQGGVRSQGVPSGTSSSSVSSSSSSSSSTSSSSANSTLSPSSTAGGSNSSSPTTTSSGGATSSASHVPGAAIRIQATTNILASFAVAIAGIEFAWLF